MTPGQGHGHDDILEALYSPRYLSLGQIKVVKIDLEMTQAILGHIFFLAQLFQRMSMVENVNLKSQSKVTLHIDVFVEEADVECFVVEVETLLDHKSSVILTEDAECPRVHKVRHELLAEHHSGTEVPDIVVLGVLLQERGQVRGQAVRRLFRGRGQHKAEAGHPAQPQEV